MVDYPRATEFSSVFVNPPGWIFTNEKGRSQQESNWRFRAFVWSNFTTLSLYLKGWTQDSIAETDEKVVVLVKAGAEEEEIGKVREAARRTVSRLIEDRGQNGKISEMSAILAKENPDEDTRSRQSIIKQYLGAHLLDPSFRAFGKCRNGRNEN